MWLIHHMHVQFEKIWAWMHEFVMLMLSLTCFGTCMWINQEIELHNVIILHWCHISMCVEIWAITCMFCWLKFELELKNSIWKNPDFLCPLERGKSRSSRKIVLPALFAELDVHSSGISHARAGSFCRQAFRSSALSHARAYFSCNQYFCRP